MAENKQQQLFLLDAYALIYRSYFAFIRNPRFNSKGVNTSAMLGVTNTIVQLIEKEDPENLAVVFDVSAPTFRHEMYKEYKANRDEMPEDLRKSIPYIRKIIEAFNIPIIEKEGYEADDVIGTLAKKAEKEGFRTYMMTPDKDYAQLVSDQVYMYKPGKAGGDVEIWGLPEVQESFGIETADQVIDILGLMGDSSDNIPGCPGIGPKTAQKLIAEYGSIEELYKNTDKLKGKQKERIVENEEQVRLSKVLATIITDAPVEFDLKKLKKDDLNKEDLKKLFDELEFKTLISRLKLSDAPVETAMQGTLFGAPEEVVAETETPATKENIESVPHQYYLVENEIQRASLRAELSVQNEFCFDTETTGLDTKTAEIVCMSFAFREHEAFCVTIPTDRKEAQKVMDEFRDIFADKNITKIGQNIKFDILILKNYDIEVKGKLYDTMLAHYLIQPDMKHNLDMLCLQYLNYEKVPTENLIGKKGKNQQTMRSVTTEKLRDYACEDADLTLQLKNVLNPELDKAGVRELFETLEMPLVPVLVKMESAGVKLNSEELNKSAEVLRKQIIELEKEIIELAGEEFNVSSPKQLGPILFEKLKIDTKAKKTKTKQYSTAEEVLIRLVDKHPIVQKVLDFRGLKKLLSTYVEALPLLVNPKTGKIHTSYNQAIAATGRLSSVNPNLQNIPIRDAAGREIRKAFIPSDDEHTFFSADYSQIELRIMAALSGDEEMQRAFNEGKDIHSITAAKIYQIPESEVDSDMRRKAKTANFGIIYGISAFGLSQRLNIPRTEAKDLIDGYFENFPKIKAFMDKQIHLAREQGFVKTIKGRRRYLKDINSANAVVRGMAERNAVNATIQGSAADIIKIAMINIHNKMEEQNLKSKMILQVHDELNFDVYKPELETIRALVKDEMENAVDVGVQLTVESNAADNWLDAH
ncbi:DNA polymerase I [Draconibacterium halophilum]|uniref:DNA polymerase I n=1 Tax=Draconibacterium halophilum TaxID=2706887 RepID=A0A6C0RIC8_9BACT|nr:DNA polymerase I [Draconibacterium halophilum]QIA09847.1 DNA polymerase I [Draconibacterium halophilum]